MKFEKEFRKAHPETIGETDTEFDVLNYSEWLEGKVQKLLDKQPCENCPEWEKIKVKYGEKNWIIHCPTCGILLK